MPTCFLSIANDPWGKHITKLTGLGRKPYGFVLTQLLAMHYIEGGVPAPIVSLVETELKSLSLWFPDPQYPFLEGGGYV